MDRRTDAADEQQAAQRVEQQAEQQVEQQVERTLTVLSTAPEKRRPLETARAVTLPWQHDKELNSALKTL
ncbi:hypothetical protein EYF80_028140 [Liparis tanakae]|uniref:Uncharacterized protein n=1 Tax=Liparis tanakae TaxID=230148 RepID=A0A4Z2H8Q3_9TELE|nr:hypothetical protein EYF80_028140 [Liparis tanakae]